MCAHPARHSYGYNASPFYQKLLSVLAVLRVEHAICATPPVMPRPMLSEELGSACARVAGCAFADLLLAQSRTAASR